MIYNMEKHIFKFGEGSMALILPKKWVDKNGLKPSNTIYLSENENGNLIIAANGTEKRDTERITDSSTNPIFVGRWIGLNYMYGTAHIHLYSKE